MKISEVVLSTGVDAILKFLASSPQDEVYTVAELSTKFDVAHSTIKSSRRLGLHREYFGGNVYYGSLTALEEFRKRIDNES